MNNSITANLKLSFIKLGVLPFLLILAIVVFSILSSNFLTVDNFTNVARQSTYLVIISIGQMFTLLTGGFDLSVGSIMAISSVTTAMTIVFFTTIFPDSVYLVILVGLMSGILVGILVGAINGLGVSLFDVSPFIMTMGVSSTVFGIALYLTGGVPISDLPDEFSDFFGYGTLFDVPIPVLITLFIAFTMYILVSHTIYGRYVYATGGNIKAAKLSGISTKKYLFMAYIICAILAAVAGLLLTARIGSGEANLGASFPLESIAACIIAGVSLRGGIGNVQSVVLGAFFIILMQNGMNLAQIESYLQIVVIGILLIVAVLADKLREKLLDSTKI